MVPEVSVIVPIYNTDVHLRRCIDSVRGQTVKNIEIILIDDGSTDDCPEICDKYVREDERIQVIHQKNQGVSAARNAGLKLAAADWVVFVDSDDWIEKNAVEVLLEKANQTDSDIVCMAAIIHSDDQKEIIRHCENEEYIVEEHFGKLFWRILRSSDKETYLGYNWGKIYRKRVLESNHCLFPDGMKVGEDVIFNLYSFWYSKKVCILDSPIYHYHMREASASNTLFPDQEEISQRYKMEIYQFMERFSLFEQFPVQYEYMLADYILSLIKMYGKSIHSIHAFRQALHSIRRAAGGSTYTRAINSANYPFELSTKEKLYFWLLKRKMYRTLILGCIVYKQILKSIFLG